MTSNTRANERIPAANQPGHHPEHEQDKPTGPPRLPARSHDFGFRFDPPCAWASRLCGITSDNARLHVDDDKVQISFGLLHLETTLVNVVAAERTGPYDWWKVIGPPHVSLADRGLTLATTTAGGVCLRFRNPVGLLRHPALTVTVDDPDDLVEFIEGPRRRAELGAEG